MTLPEAKDTLSQMLITPVKEMSIETLLTYVEAFQTVIADEDPDDFHLHRERLFSIFDRLHRHLLLLQKGDNSKSENRQPTAEERAKTEKQLSADVDNTSQPTDSDTAQQDNTSNQTETKQTIENGPSQQANAFSRAETSQSIDSTIASNQTETSQTLETKTDIEKQTIEETEYERIIEAMRFITYGIDFVPTPRHESTLLSLQL